MLRVFCFALALCTLGPLSVFATPPSLPPSTFKPQPQETTKPRPSNLLPLSPSLFQILSPSLSQTPSPLLSQAPSPAEPPKPSTPSKSGYFRYGAGLRGGLLFLPEWFLTGLFFDEAEGLTSGGFAAEFFLRTSETFEYSFALGWHSISFPQDTDAKGQVIPSVFLNKGSNADQREFVVNTLSYISLDVRFIKLFPVHRYVHILLGGGIGLGFVLGRITRTDTYIPGYTGQDGPYKEEYRLWKQDKTNNPLSNRPCERVSNGRDCKLHLGLPEDKGIKNHGTNDAAEGRLEDRVPPVIPIIDAFFGLSFPLHERFTLRLQTGIGLPRLFWLELGLHTNF